MGNVLLCLRAVSVWREKITKHHKEHPTNSRCVKGWVYRVDEESFWKWRAISGTGMSQLLETKGVCDIESADEEGSAEDNGQTQRCLTVSDQPYEPVVKQVPPPA